MKIMIRLEESIATRSLCLQIIYSTEKSVGIQRQRLSELRPVALAAF